MQCDNHLGCHRLGWMVTVRVRWCRMYSAFSIGWLTVHYYDVIDNSALQTHNSAL